MLVVLSLKFALMQMSVIAAPRIRKNFRRSLVMTSLLEPGLLLIHALSKEVLLRLMHIRSHLLRMAVAPMLPMPQMCGQTGMQSGLFVAVVMEAAGLLVMILLHAATAAEHGGLGLLAVSSARRPRGAPGSPRT